MDQRRKHGERASAYDENFSYPKSERQQWRQILMKDVPSIVRLLLVRGNLRFGETEASLTGDELRIVSGQEIAVFKLEPSGVWQKDFERSNMTLATFARLAENIRKLTQGK